MRRWKRRATLQVNDKLFSFNDMNFEFTVPFEDSVELQTASFKIYNLSESTRNSIEKSHYVILNAGYEDDMGCLFSGGVDGCTSKRTGTDWVTEITAMTAIDQALGCKITKTYNTGISAHAIVTDLLNIFGLEVGQFDLVFNNQYPRGRVCEGKVRDVLEEIVVDECKSRMLVRDGMVHISDPRQGLYSGYILTPESGLLLGSGIKQTSVISSAEQEKWDDEDKAREAEKIVRECLLNHNIGPADIIDLATTRDSGRYMVTAGKHTGSRSGKFITEMELMPF